MVTGTIFQRYYVEYKMKKCKSLIMPSYLKIFHLILLRKIYKFSTVLLYPILNTYMKLKKSSDN